MTRKQFSVFSCVISMFLTCGGVFSMAAETELPVADGQAVYDYITKTNPYQKWDQYPGKGELYSCDYHGKFMTTYVSPNTLEAIKSKTGPLPDNSFIVSAVYKGNKVLAGTMVMYRVKDYAAEAGDWFWAKYSAGGKIQIEGKVALCIDCHVSVKKRDWVYIRSIK